MERTIRSNLSGIDFPEGVGTPFVLRISNDVFPVLQLSVLGDRDIPSLQKIVDDLIVSTIEGVPGVAEVNVLGESEEQIQVTMDVQALEDLNLPASRVAAALSDTNVSIPAGTIDDRGRGLLGAHFTPGRFAGRNPGFDRRLRIQSHRDADRSPHSGFRHSRSGDRDPERGSPFPAPTASPA